MGKDWLVTNDGHCLSCDVNPQVEQVDFEHPYRLYRFLTDLETILDNIPDDYARLEAIRPLVRKLLASASWLSLCDLTPNPETGWEVSMLYDEPFFPLTVQLVVWSSNMVSPIHNHGCWGLVALLDGAEKNTFWNRYSTDDCPDQVKPVGEQMLETGDILCLMPDAIHQIEAISEQPTLSFNLYGETNYDQRFEFDPIKGIAKNF